MDNIEKELYEKISGGPHLDLIVKEKIEKRVSDLFNKYKRWVQVILGFGVILVGFLGYEGRDFYRQKMFLENEIQKFENKLENFNEIINVKQDAFDNKLEELELKSSEIDQKSEKGLTDLNSLKEEISVWFSTQLQTKINNMNLSIQDYEEYKKTLQDKIQVLENYENSISGQIDSIESDIKMIRTNSSVRYLFIERGDRTKTKYYRGKNIYLPFTDNEKIEIVFWEVLSEDDPKEISLDITINDQKKSLNFKEREIYEYKSKNGYEFIIEPVFIYVPPNPITLLRGGYKIPDFTIVKIYLLI